MLMPVASVSIIGLVGALVAVAAGWHRVGSAVVRGVGGAWVGFLAGAVGGLAVDVVAGTGVWVAYVGHLGAVVGTVLGLAGPTEAGARPTPPVGGYGAVPAVRSAGPARARAGGRSPDRAANRSASRVGPATTTTSPSASTVSGDV